MSNAYHNKTHNLLEECPMYEPTRTAQFLVFRATPKEFSLKIKYFKKHQVHHKKQSDQQTLV